MEADYRLQNIKRPVDRVGQSQHSNSRGSRKNRMKSSKKHHQEHIPLEGFIEVGGRICVERLRRIKLPNLENGVRQMLFDTGDTEPQHVDREARQHVKVHSDGEYLG